MWGFLEQTGVRFVRTSLQSLQSFAPQSWNTMQQRSIVSIDVHANRVDKAYRTLKRKVVEEGFKETWSSQAVYMKPSQERKLAAVATAKRLKKRVFREKLRWLQRARVRFE